ncbi:MAG: acireductone synthase [Gammaproteobacteria bacterium HGW-Gammaproteobacteria-14]|nr:MAG: acireductone synthase [Gammaproteobacteria bacterium HGW-Gammaproteobacteria-14]
MIKAIVSDIEGTTSSISFVKEVLFPYAAKHLPDFLQQHWQDNAVQTQILAMADLTGTPINTAEEANRILQGWIAEDRKATPLKTLQGMIWKAGYESGAYTAHLYPDTAPALRQWHDKGLPLFIYSSGSIAAQKLFFRYSDAGDLTPLLSDYFDTTTGAKQDTDSYRKIADHIGLAAEHILFLSDIEAELNAARAAGMQTILLDREQQAPHSEHPVVSAFSEIVI